MDTHPYLNEPESKRVRTMGELAYNRARMAEAKAWISTHPAAFAKLTLRRVGLFHQRDDHRGAEAGARSDAGAVQGRYRQALGELPGL